MSYIPDWTSDQITQKYLDTEHLVHCENCSSPADEKYAEMYWNEVNGLMLCELCQESEVCDE